MDEKNYYSDITRQKYSAKEFLHMLEKRLRKHLRVQLQFDTKQTYVVHKKNAVASIFLESLFSSLFQDRLDITFVDSQEELSQNKNNSRILLLDDILELYLAKKLGILFQNKNFQFLLQKQIAPLQCVSFKELQQYAQLKGLLDYELASTQEQEFISFVQNKYPQTKTSMLKTFLFLENSNV